MLRKISLRLAVTVLVLLLLCFTTMVRAEEQQEITVSAAISLKNAFEEIGKQFAAKHRGVKIYFNFGASGDLMKQIEAGAPIDIFASAAIKEMEEIKQKKLLLNDSFQRFAVNEVVLIMPLKASLSLNSFDDLKKEAVKRVAVGNPKTVPAGRYAQEILTYFKLWDTIKDKFILAENVRQVVDYVARGEVDAGIVYATDALAMAHKVQTVATAPVQSHQPVVYPLAVLKQTQNSSLAKLFIEFVASPEGKRILQQCGFNPVK